MGAVRDKLEKFLNRQIEKGNVNWPNQAALIRAAGFKNTTGETSRVMANFVDKFTFDDFTDTDLFRKFLNEKEVEQIYGIKANTLRRQRWGDYGLPFHKLGNTVLYSIEDIDKMLKRTTPTNA